MDLRPEATEPTASPRRRRTAAAAVAAAVLLAGALVLILSSNHHGPSAAAAPRPVTTTHPALPAPVAPATTAPPAPVIPHDSVAPAVPTAFTFTGPKFTIKAHVCAMAPVFPLDPPGEQRHTVCWVRKGFGVKPGSNSATSYVLGHSWAEDDQEVLNRLSAPATREILVAKPVDRDGVPTYPVHALDGYRLVLRTPNGTLTYKVHDAYGVAKLKLGQVKSTLNPRVRKRIVLITCAERKGVDYDYNVVVNAYLWSSKSSAASAAKA